MDFELSEEQQLIQDSVERFVSDHYTLEARAKLAATRQGWSDEHWRMMAELGWLGLTLPESEGGFGGSQIDTMLLMEQFGKGLVLEPYLASCVLGAPTLARGGCAELKQSLLPGVMDGTVQLTVGYAEEQARFDLHDVVTHAQLDKDHYVINGHKSMVQNGATATHLIVSARTSGGQVDQSGITLLLIPADATGVEVTGFPTVDGQQAAELKLTDVTVPKTHLIGEQDQGFALLNQAIVDGILAVSAEAVGAMEVLYKDTVAYTSEREQFDHPLSDFQVLQHRMVDMFMEYEQCKSLLYRATLETVTNADNAQRTVHALKHFVGKTGIMIGENAVQLHGGMGMTEVLRVGRCFKRLLVIDAQFGNADHHLQQFAA